jgi:hypothetical protein
VLKNEKKLPESIQEFLDLSKDPETFTLFLDSFVSCVVGRMEWKKMCREERISKVASATDEAFALLVLENIWEPWRNVDPMEYLVARTKRRKHSDDSDENDKSSRRQEIPGCYTKGHRKAKRFRGWGEEGHARYNELVRHVREDRAKRELYEIEYLERKKKNKKEKQGGSDGTDSSEKEKLEDDWGTLFPDL